MKIALVHDYLTQKGGAERVFELLCARFPDADIFTSIYAPEQTIDLRHRQVKTTPLQYIPGATRHFRLLAPFYFPAFRRLNLDQYDLVLSSSSSFAKAVKTPAHTQHICFCHNVTRFLWDTQTYLRGFKEFQAVYPLLQPLLEHMRRLDREYAAEPNLYVANSSLVADRIRRFYRRPAVCIHYPIDPDRFEFSDQKDNFYLVSCRLMSYKRVDLVVEAFNWLGWPLVIMGDGPERERLEALALDNIKFVGFVSDRERTRLLAKARMVIVAALEDYGLVPIEANFSGTPVMAFGSGGVLDTQIVGTTGLFFDRQSPDSLQRQLLATRHHRWDYRQIHQYALDNFTEAAFYRKLDDFLQAALSPTLARAIGRSRHPVPSP